MMQRRAWLKSAFAVTSGVTLTAGLTERIIAAPLSKAERAVPPLLNAAVRLNSNENPFGPSDKAKRAILAAALEGNRYPFDLTSELKQILAAHEGVTVDHIHLGAGSGELLSQTGKAFGSTAGAVLSAFPTFPMLMTHAETFSARWDKVNLNDKLEHDYDAMMAAITSDTRLVFVCNPNNPTGTLVDPQTARSFCMEASRKTTVFSDEAYLEFLNPDQQVSMVELVKKDMNVIVSRTFSKVYGLAGMRIGYIIARPDLIKKVAKYAGDIPISIASVSAAKASLGDKEFMAMTRRKNAEARKVLTDYLDKKGIFYGKSHTNFVFFPAPAAGKAILAGMQEQGYLMRIWDYKQKEWCRVSVGTVEQMQGFVKTFSSMFS